MMPLKESLLIAGQWSHGTHSVRSDVINPATGEVIAQLTLASADDIDRALAAAEHGFRRWRATPVHERSAILRRAAGNVRERAEAIGALITREQGKPIAEAVMEVQNAADHIDWYAEEGRRAYGRLIPARAAGVRQMVLREPVGPVAAFSPWNFPVGQLVRKIAGALAAGCSIIAKAPEETPSCCIEVCRAFEDAGLPAGALGLLFGVPAQVSEQLIQSPIIRKVSFTGSVPVGRLLASQAGQHLKRCTMELGGHAPFIVCDDTDVEAVAKFAAVLKFRNAGQVCISPTRFYVQKHVHAAFVDAFVKAAATLVVGAGADPQSQMGPLANPRRVLATQEFVDDAVRQGATVALGGQRPSGDGFFYPATILTQVPDTAKVMTEEPFGPIAAVAAFDTLSEVIEKANALPLGLAAYVFTGSLRNATLLSDGLESGMISVNHFGLASPETPFGGVKDSGYGSEGGSEGLEAYLITKFVSQAS